MTTRCRITPLELHLRVWILKNRNKHASASAQQSLKYNIRSMRAHLKPGEINDLFALKAYVQLNNDGEGRTPLPNNWQK